MGILNMTTDSFSGDGLGGNWREAVARGKFMFEAGADMVDVGGESTRPGAEPVPFEVEVARTIRVVEELSALHPGRISIDTMKPQVANEALYAGASIVNDISGLRDSRMIAVVAEHDAAVIIMHMKGEPRTMQRSPKYRDVVREVKEYLADRIGVAEKAGINPRKIMIDPGIGFGKTVEHNLELIAGLSELRQLGKPVVIGVSRKSFIGRITGMPADKRLEGSLAAAVVAVREGANIIRAHDVPETVRALKVANAIWPTNHGRRMHR
jgi:dihydropteroate synthase